MKRKAFFGSGTVALLALLGSFFLQAFLPIQAGALATEAISYEKAEEPIRVSSRFLELLFNKKQPEPAGQTRHMLLGGDLFGAKIYDEGPVVVAVPEGEGCPLRVGDVILAVGDTQVTDAKALAAAVKAAENAEVTLKLRREGQLQTVTLHAKEKDGVYSLGIRVKDGAAGIGTVTFIDPSTGMFGGLGHGICDPADGKVVPMVGGHVTDVSLGGITKGESGKPGELRGVLKKRPKGALCANTECGVFGLMEQEVLEGRTSLPLGSKEEVHVGEATVYATLKNGQIGSYQIQITHIENTDSPTKSFRVKVTDAALIAISGGIVRGMSGSPIVQDGKLIGALTHVMIGEPTEGYGIFIENMLAAMPAACPRAA